MSLARKLARLGSAGPGSTPKVAHHLESPEATAPASHFAEECSVTTGAVPLAAAVAPEDDALARIATLRADLDGEPDKHARIAKLRAQLDQIASRERSHLRDRDPVAVRVAREDARDGGSLFARALRETVHVRPRDIGRALPGERAETPHGPMHRVTHWLEPRHCHGRAPVAAALTAPNRCVAELSLDPKLEHVDLRKMLLVDTETTGLNQGTGTLAFLIGVAFFEDESLCVEQLLLTRLGDEPAILRHVADRIAAASCVVSYNGKSFDWPLLRTRFVMNRVPVPPLPPHLDLLHCSRRVFKARMESVRLVDMEREVMDMHREHDVGGAEIPGIYLHFLRSGEPGRLDGVVEHNGHDLVALAALLGELAKRFENVRAQDDPRDHLAYARVATRAGNLERAERFAWAAAEGGGDARCTEEALLLAAKLARKAKDVAKEETALGLALARTPTARVHLELAKLYEHRKKDPAKALDHARMTWPVEDETARAKRVARLEKRIERGAKALVRSPNRKRDPSA